MISPFSHLSSRGARRLAGLLATGAALVLIVGLAPPAMAAGTVVPGGNLSTQTWTKAGSPYVVQGDVTVPAGETLTIQFGVAVQFAGSDGTASGDDTARIEFVVNGSLLVNGAPTEPVTMDPAPGAGAGTWYGVIVGAGASAATIQSLVQSGAQVGLRSAAPGSVLTVSGSTFSDNAGTGIYLEAGEPSITDVEIARSAGSGLVTAPSSSAAPSLARVTVAGSGVDGLHLTATSGDTTVVNSTVSGNARFGVLKNGNGADLSVNAATIAGNGVRALTRNDSSSVAVGGSVLADSGTGSDPDCAGGLTSTGDNVIEDASSCGALDPTDITGRDAGLLPLADNGGPTRTQALGAASPAVDAGGSSCRAFDQRGIARPADGDADGTAACDIGAYELLVKIDGFTYRRILVTQTMGIAGHGLSEAFNVRFRGGSTTELTHTGDRLIEFVVPIGALSGRVRVDLPDRTLVTPTPMKVAPWVRTVDPFSAPRGSTITIGGYTFTGAKRVTVGGTAAEFVVDSYRQITAVVPMDARTGFTRVKVTTVGGTGAGPRFRVT